MPGPGDNQDQFRVIQGGDPALDSFLGAVDRLQNQAPVDQQAIRDFVLDSSHGELLESMLTESLRLGRMNPEADEAIKQDAQAIIASVRDPEVELTPDLAKRRDHFFQQVAPILSMVNSDTSGDNNGALGEATRAAKNIIDDKKEK